MSVTYWTYQCSKQPFFSFKQLARKLQASKSNACRKKKQTMPGYNNEDYIVPTTTTPTSSCPLTSSSSSSNVTSSCFGGNSAASSCCCSFCSSSSSSSSSNLYFTERRTPTARTTSSSPSSKQLLIQLPHKHIALDSVNSDESIKNVKVMIETKTGYRRKQYYLVFGGKTLEESHTLNDYNVQENSTIILNFYVLGGGKINNPSAAAAANNNNNANNASAAAASKQGGNQEAEEEEEEQKKEHYFFNEILKLLFIALKNNPQINELPSSRTWFDLIEKELPERLEYGAFHKHVEDHLIGGITETARFPPLNYTISRLLYGNIVTSNFDMLIMQLDKEFNYSINAHINIDRDCELNDGVWFPKWVRAARKHYDIKDHLTVQLFHYMSQDSYNVYLRSGSFQECSRRCLKGEEEFIKHYMIHYGYAKTGANSLDFDEAGRYRAGHKHNSDRLDQNLRPSSVSSSHAHVAERVTPIDVIAAGGIVAFTKRIFPAKGCVATAPDSIASHLIAALVGGSELFHQLTYCDQNIDDEISNHSTGRYYVLAPWRTSVTNANSFKWKIPNSFKQHFYINVFRFNSSNEIGSFSFDGNNNDNDKFLDELRKLVSDKNVSYYNNDVGGTSVSKMEVVNKNCVRLSMKDYPNLHISFDFFMEVANIILRGIYGFQRNNDDIIVRVGVCAGSGEYRGDKAHSAFCNRATSAAGVDNADRAQYTYAHLCEEEFCHLGALLQLVTNSIKERVVAQMITISLEVLLQYYVKEQHLSKYSLLMCYGYREEKFRELEKMTYKEMMKHLPPNTKDPGTGVDKFHGINGDVSACCKTQTDGVVYTTYFLDRPPVEFDDGRMEEREQCSAMIKTKMVENDNGSRRERDDSPEGGASLLAGAVKAVQNVASSGISAVSSWFSGSWFPENQNQNMDNNSFQNNNYSSSSSRRPNCRNNSFHPMEHVYKLPHFQEGGKVIKALKCDECGNVFSSLSDDEYLFRCSRCDYDVCCVCAEEMERNRK